MQIAFEKDGKMAENYRGEKNLIPYQSQDAKRLLTQLTKDEQEMEWSKQIVPVMIELAHNFMLEIIARPVSQSDTVSSYLETIQTLMGNIRAKFPELASEANQLFHELLQEWQQKQLKNVKQFKLKSKKIHSTKLFGFRQKSKHQPKNQYSQQNLDSFRRRFNEQCQNQQYADNLQEHQVSQLLGYLNKDD